MTGSALDEAVTAWAVRDRACAVLPADRQVIETSRSVRTMILEIILEQGREDDLYDACAVLGQLIARDAGSPSLASLTFGHALEALGTRAEWLPKPTLEGAQAAIAEGFATVLVEVTRRAALRSWDFPNCIVLLGNSTIAVAAGHPSDDDELLVAWASGVAQGAALSDIRRAEVGGPDSGRHAVIEALMIAGIAVANTPRLA